jgi:hypothetical protein
MSDAADRLAQVLRDLINEAVQETVERERPTPPTGPAILAAEPLTLLGWWGRVKFVPLR